MGPGPRVKICGIRSAADLTIAVASGADAVGFISGVTHRSDDALTPERAAELVAATPPYVSTVLVTHLEHVEEIVELAETLGVDTIQVHGLVSHETLREVFAQSHGRRRITRAVHVTGEESRCTARHCKSRMRATPCTWTPGRRIASVEPAEPTTGHSAAG